MSENNASQGDERAEHFKTLKVKLKPGQSKWLEKAAMEVNTVWNWCAEVCEKAARPYAGKAKHLSAYDLHALLAGTSAELSCLRSMSIARVATEYVAKLRQHRKARLRWRVSSGPRKSLGWVPFRDGQARFKGGAVMLGHRRFRIFDSYDLSAFKFRSGSFSQNALGEWFVNIVVHAPEPATQELPTKAVGIDLGLRTIATASDGQTLPAGRWTKEIADKLAVAQRRGHKRQAKRLHRKAANRRKDALHKFSSKLVKECGAIYIGDVSSSKLVKTRMAKSVHDSGWGMFRTMLQSKGHQAGRLVEIVNERFTTRVCSNCGQDTGPRGLKQLGVTGWSCSGCGREHSRDVNAARNILACGLAGPSAGTNRRHALRDFSANGRQSSESVVTPLSSEKGDGRG